MKKSTINLLALTASLLFVATASAEGKDVLVGLMPDVKNTINGTGKYLLYAGELVMASVAYIKTRNMTAFGGVAALALFLNFMMGMI